MGCPSVAMLGDLGVIPVEACQAACDARHDCDAIEMLRGDFRPQTTCLLYSHECNENRAEGVCAATKDCIYLQRVCDDKQNRFAQISGEETCESFGYVRIMDPDVCEAAAVFLGKRDTTVTIHTKHQDANDRPAGCTYHGFGHLELWTESTGVCTFGEGCLCSARETEAKKNLKL